jgi:hypothetical protein
MFIPVLWNQRIVKSAYCETKVDFNALSIEDTPVVYLSFPCFEVDHRLLVYHNHVHLVALVSQIIIFHRL